MDQRTKWECMSGRSQDGFSRMVDDKSNDRDT